MRWQSYKSPSGSSGSPPQPLVESMRQAASKSPLLVRLRTLLAEEKVQGPPREYSSFCRHVAAEACQLPVAAVANVPRAAAAPSPLRVPVVVEPRPDWPPLQWDLGFWRQEHGECMWQCASRYPPLAGEAASAVSRLQVSVRDFVDYVDALEGADPRCCEEHALAFPRFTLGGWRPFASTTAGRRRWDDDWAARRRLWAPPGVKDFTARWVNMACDTLGHSRWDEALAGFDEVQLSPAGGITRLHVSNSRAHMWYGQMAGQSVFFLFSPDEGARLHARTVEAMRPEERRQYSPVDIFRPDESRHPKFKDSSALATLLEPGEVLVVPSGWWLYSAALEPSAVLSRRYWNRANKAGMYEEFRGIVLGQELTPEIKALYQERLEQLRELIEEDDMSDVDDGGE